MIFGPFVRSWRGTMKENKIHRISIICLSVAAVFLSIKNFWSEPVVVLVPSTLSKQLEVGKRTVGEEFSKIWGLHMALLLGNVSPDNADFVKEAVGRVLDPTIHQQVMATIEKQIQDIKLDRVSQWFEGKRVLYERSSNRVFVTGYGVTKGPTGKETRGERTYEFEIVAEQYAPVIRYLATYSGDPKTEREVEREQREQERERKKRLREEHKE